MKNLFHFPTLLLHLALLFDANLTINNFPGFFLPSALVILIAYFICIARRIRAGAGWKGILLTFYAGFLLQLWIFESGIIDVNSGAFGLGGGEFALFFYQTGLGIAAILMPLIAALFVPRKE